MNLRRENLSNIHRQAVSLLCKTAMLCIENPGFIKLLKAKLINVKELYRRKIYG